MEALTIAPKAKPLSCSASLVTVPLSCGWRWLQLPPYDDARAKAALRDTGIACPLVDATLVRRYIERFVVSGYLPRPGCRAPFAEPVVFARAEGRVVPPPNLDGIPDLVARSLELEPAKRPTSVELATALQRGSTPNANRKR